MSASRPGGVPESVRGPDYRAERFAVLTGSHACYRCHSATRVSAIGLLGYQERDRESGEYDDLDEAVLLTQITALERASAEELVGRAPWMRLADSKTAGHAYLANHCEHCDAMIGAWHIKKPGEAFFPATSADIGKLDVEWFQQKIEIEDDGGTLATWLDQLLTGRESNLTSP